MTFSQSSKLRLSTRSRWMKTRFVAHFISPFLKSWPPCSSFHSLYFFVQSKKLPWDRQKTQHHVLVHIAHVNRIYICFLNCFLQYFFRQFQINLYNFTKIKLFPVRLVWILTKEPYFIVFSFLKSIWRVQYYLNAMLARTGKICPRIGVHYVIRTSICTLYRFIMYWIQVYVHCTGLYWTEYKFMYIVQVYNVLNTSLCTGL